MTSGENEAVPIAALFVPIVRISVLISAFVEFRDIKTLLFIKQA